MYFLIIDWGGVFSKRNFLLFRSFSAIFSHFKPQEKKNYATALLTFQHPFSVEISSYLKIG